jgi:hypothetical protein
MDFILLEQWLVELVPPEHKKAIGPLIECIRENAPLQFIVGMHSLYPLFNDEDPKIKASSINGLLVGISLAQAWKVNPIGIQETLRGFVDYASKKRGENVYDFLAERAKHK